MIHSVGVIGSGTMGLGIAQLTAMAGYPTTLYDLNEEALKRAVDSIQKNLNKGVDRGKVDAASVAPTMERIRCTTDISSVKADFIIEAIVEKLDVKRQVFKRLEEINGPETILASNTSSIPITQIAAGMTNPERFVGMHFFNPAHIMKLVEVIKGAATSDQTIENTMELASELGKTAVQAADSPGFIVNRVARHFYVESLKILEENVADVESIDALLRSSGFKMGPFELMDLIGVDTNFSVTESMFRAFYEDAKFRPSRIQKQKVDAGHHGRKSGKGFYEY